MDAQQVEKTTGLSARCVPVLHVGGACFLPFTSYPLAGRTTHEVSIIIINMLIDLYTTINALSLFAACSILRARIEYRRNRTLGSDFP